MTTTEPEVETAVTVNLNGTEISAEKGEMLIDAAERNGVYIPRFCYHPRMKPVGMCRMCLVEVDTGRGMGLQPSCMVPVSDGMTVDTESEVTKKAQDGILEFLLINHPLDCPICDKGGECPLQDQTMAYGPGESRFVEEKRHFKKPIPISDTVFLDRERCILCDRCTRFAKEVAGDPLIHFQARGNQTEVNTFPDEPFSSYFSGNTVQICPVGALTAKPYRFKARPWDLTETPSTATTDSVGSRITVQSSRNEVLRYLGVDSDAVNWGWLSDKERFNFEAWNSDARVTTPLVRGDNLGAASDDGEQLVGASWSMALAKAAAALTNVDPERVAFIGGARMSNESQYAWAKLAKSVVGTDNVDAQLGDGLDARLVLGLPRATIADACAPGGTIVVLGADPKETHGALFLRLRHAAEHDKATLIEVGPRAGGLAPYAKATDIVRFSQLGAHLDAALAEGAKGPLATALRGPVTVVYGPGPLGTDPAVIESALVQLTNANSEARFLPAMHRSNIMGAFDMGLAPGLMPGRATLGEVPETWDKVPSTTGHDTAAILHRAANGGIDTIVLLGADPLTDFPDAGLAESAMNKVSNLISVDTLLNFTSTGADVVLPAAATATEINGSFTNIEGRVSPIGQKVTAPGTARADWMIAAELAAQLGTDLGFIDLDELWTEINQVSALHADLSMATITAADSEGVLLTGASVGSPRASTSLREQPRDGFELLVHRKMYDAGTILTYCPSLQDLPAGAKASMSAATATQVGVTAGDEVTVSNGGGQLSLEVVVDDAVAPETVAIEFNQSNATAGRLLSVSSTVTSVSVEAAS